MEQLAARRAHNPKVGGSSPPPATKADNSTELSVFLFAGMNGRANGALFAAGVDTIKFPKP